MNLYVPLPYKLSFCSYLAYCFLGIMLFASNGKFEAQIHFSAFGELIYFFETDEPKCNKRPLL